jgi:hypothetical protein
MQAANEGARAAQASQGVQSIGIRARDLLHSAAPLRAHVRRLHRCLGGLGTLLESMMLWQAWLCMDIMLGGLSALLDVRRN